MFQQLTKVNSKRWTSDVQKELKYGTNEVQVSYMMFWTLHRESKKGCHPNHGYNFVNSWWISKLLSLL